MRTVIALILTLPILSITGCSRETSETMDVVDEGKYDLTHIDQKHLVRGNVVEPSTLDPHRAHANFEGNIMRDLLEGLVIAGVEGMEPAVAERWESDGSRVFTFNLRKNARWSNGDPVVAGDFVFSWRRLASPGTGATCVDFLSEAGIKNAGPIQRGETPAEQLGVAAVNPHTLRVTLEKPNALFIDMLARTCSLPLHKSTLELFPDKWTRPGHFVGNGAFTLNDWVVNEKVELVRNPLYWNAANVKLDQVTYLPTSPAIAELNRYQAGEIDITSGVPPDQLEKLRREMPAEMHASPAIWTSGWTINTDTPPLDNPRLRKALAYAIDRGTIAKITGLGTRPAYKLSPLRIPGDTDHSAAWQNWSQLEREDRAKVLYAEAGFGPGKPLRIHLQSLNKGSSSRIAAAAAAMWKRILGAEVILQQYDWKTLVDRVQQGDFVVSIYVYEGHYNEPSAFLRSQLSSTEDPANYANPEFDSLIERARHTEKLAERLPLYTQAEQLLARDMPFIPLLQGNAMNLVKPHVKGYRPNSLTYVYSKDLSIDSSEYEKRFEQ